MSTDALALIEDVRRACRITDGQDPLDETADLRLKHEGLQGIAHWLDDNGFALHRDGELDLAVRPEARHRGIGSRLAALATSAPGPLAAWSHGDHPAAAVLAREHGFERARELWVMRRPASEPVPEFDIPDGVRIRRYAGKKDDEALLAANAAAFADHPEQGALDGDGLAKRMAEPWFDPAGLLIAVDETDHVLGFHWTKRHDRRNGEVYVLCVTPGSQRRGLGRVLTAAGVQHLSRRRVKDIHLYVEGDNEPAIALYSGLGFTHSPSDTHVQYLRA